MQLIETITPRGTRFYLDGTRITRERAIELKRTHDMDTLQTRITGDETRHYTCLRKRAA